MQILHGVNASPFVRKALLGLAFKGIDYQLNAMMPMGVSAEYKQKSPLGKIPCWEDGDFTLPDSSCILAYLEKVKPTPALYPGDAKAYGRALWLEEYADTKLSDAVGPIFFERIVKAKIMKAPVDEARVQEAIEKKLPESFDYLESQAPESGDALVGGRFSVADIAVGSQLLNLRHAGVRPDAKRWPKLSAWLEAVHTNPCFKPIVEEEVAQFSAM
jgi:glutathione S-transferase